MSNFLIVGQGLAGTALAWQLLRRGRAVRITDDDRGGASRLAAGLITPVTGKRLAISWRWDELRPVAGAFYRAVEAETGARFFHERPALRIFASEAERDEFRRRAEMLRDLVRPAEVPDCFAAPFGGFEMPAAARLDVPRYLDASRAHFRARGIFGAPADCEGATTIDCRGYAPDCGLRFNAAKGEILTVRVPGLAEERVVHRGIWLAPVGTRDLSPAKPGFTVAPVGTRDLPPAKPGFTVAPVGTRDLSPAKPGFTVAPVGHELYRAGATYAHDPLDAVPTPEGRAEIESKLRAFLTRPFEVIDHCAAVRPVIDAGFPVLGRDPANPRRAYFNGLGSKGALLSPFFADELAALL
ncbi:MAG: FAD-binding oxidoreductase [Planctomycetes bacterium]|nr:FAD-binding oxidoreductase [Planctomycetota bacterium]